MAAPNADQAEFWEEIASSWLANEAHEGVASHFGPLAIDRLALQPGQRVLDIGCGSGPTTLELARRVGADGEAVGVDIAPSLAAAARQHAVSAGIDNARFVVADAQVADLGANGFDAVYSQFGVMFFDDPEAAFANIRRSMRAGGTLAFVSWQDLFANEWMFVPGSAVITATGELPPMPGPGEPGPFSLADPDRVHDVLQRAGFSAIDVTPHAETIVQSGDAIDSWVRASSRVGPVREALRKADDDTRAKVLAAVDEALQAKVVDGELRLTAAALVVTARA